MKKINPIMLVVIILVGGFCAFKIMSFLGCYVRIEDVNECWKLTAWQSNEKTFSDRSFCFMTLEIIIILLTVLIVVYFLFRPTSKKEKERFEDKDNWRGGF